MSALLQFTISSDLKKIIGRELIVDDFIAIFELVKNSYDANARRVDIIFKHIETKRDPKRAKIFIVDDGDGMNLTDLQGKWLLVGYSWKSEQEKRLESEDFREKLTERRIFAGAKGIGRFSCDKLGSRLRLYTKKEEEDFVHVLDVDWDKFEEDYTKEFQTIDVRYDTLGRLNAQVHVENFKKGTILEISSLREEWDRKKLLRLKRHLQRLINPAQVSEEQEFKIYLKAEECLEEDKRQKEDHDRVNGIVRNVIFEQLGIRTTHVSCRIENGAKIHTRLVDKGTFIYNIEEDNEYPSLHDVNIELFYLNPSAKAMFTRTMGIQPVRYGSVFFYKNGIKINPYGNEGDDWLGLDRRKTQGTRRFLGNRDLVGRIEVTGNQPHFRETSSRDGGVIKTPQLGLLKKFFVEKSLRRLEKYVVEGINWDSERRPKDPDKIKIDSFKLIGRLAGEVKGRKIEFNEDLLDIYTKKQIEKTPELIKNIEAVRKHVKTKEARAYIDLQVKTVRTAFRDLRKRQRKLEKDLKRKTLFLERATGEERKEIMVLNHHIGLSAEVIRNHLLELQERVRRGETVSNEDLKGIIDIILLRTQMMSSITSFVTRVSFDLMPQVIERDLVRFVKQYIERVYVPLDKSISKQDEVEIRVHSARDAEFIYSFNPFKFIVIIDNLISNSKKAKAKQVDVIINVLDGNVLQIKVRDDGIGISDKNVKRIFDFGFSTTKGSGIGLYHVKEILEEEKYGSIRVNNQLDKGVEFIIEVVKSR